MSLSNIFTVRINAAANSLPNWVPAPGEVAVAPTTNSFFSVDPCSNDSCIYNNTYNGVGNEHVIDAWNAATYNPYWGENGAYVIHGGGHNDYGGNEVYILDLNDLTWKRLDDPSTNIDIRHDGIPKSLSNNTYCEYADGQPASCHSYDNLCVVPSGALGALVRPVSNACGKESYQTGYSHIWDFNNPSGRWSRFSSNAWNNNNIGVHGYSCYDSNRNCIWTFATNPLGVIGKLDCATGSWTMYSTTNSPAPRTDSAFCQYSAQSDLVIIGGSNSTREFTHFWYFDPNNPTAGATRVTKSRGLPPSSSTGFVGGDLCSDNNKLYVITPADQYEQGVFEVTIPQNPADTWPVEWKPWAGDPAAIQEFSSGINEVVFYGKRMTYCSKIKCFVFLPMGRGYNTLLFRPEGV